MKRVLLLGGGHAHVQLLEAYAREPLRGAELTLLTPSSRAVYSGMVPGFVAGHYTLDECSIALAPLAERAGARLVAGAATALDTRARTVRAGEVECGYDVLSIDTGAVQSREAIAGAREHALFVRPIEPFTAGWEQLVDRAAQRTPGRPLAIVVIGGGAAGVELALAMQHRLLERARVSLVSGGAAPLDGYPAAVQRRGAAALERASIRVVLDRAVAVTGTHVELAAGAPLACDAAVIAVGTDAPGWLRGSGLALDARGFVATGPTLQSTSHPEVFAAGDVASRVDAPHPKSGVYAVRAGPPLARNLRRFLEGTALERYRPRRRSLNLISLGAKRAIVSWGALAAEGDWAWRWKDRIDRGFVGRFDLTRAP